MKKNQLSAADFNRIGWEIHTGTLTDEPDPDRAIPYYEKAAALGDTRAMVNLGNIYEEREDYERAYYWYFEAAIRKNEDGMFNVANLYHWGWGVERNYPKAYAFFKLLYEMGYPGAAFYMGVYSENGHVGETDYAAALRYYAEGLAAGDRYCAVNLGRMYSLGLGTPKDERKGFEYYRMGYEAGDLLAYVDLGWCYEVGQGTEKDPELALACYREGAEQGEENCIEALKRLEAEK